MTEMQPQDVEFDVSAAIGEPATVAGTYFPHTGPPGPAKAVLVCLPGGTYNRGYFDLEVPGHPGYSFARHAAADGYAVLALDQLGTGAGSRPNRDVDLTDLAAAAASAVAAFPEKLGHDGPFLAVAHSMGGYVAMLQQAAHRSYRGLAILGTTNQYVAQRPPTPEAAALAETPEGRAALVEQIAAAFPEPRGLPDRSRMRSWFHHDDVPDAVITADDATTRTVVPPRAGAQASIPGTTRDAAATIDVPVFLGYGEVDVSPAPHQEPTYFPHSQDITLHLLPNSAHCHNMATTRHVQWGRLLRWCDEVSAQAPMG